MYVFPLLDVLSFCSSQHWFHNFPDTNYRLLPADSLLCKTVSLMQLCDRIFKKNCNVLHFQPIFRVCYFCKNMRQFYLHFSLNYHTYIFSYTDFISTIFIAPCLLLFSLALHFFLHFSLSFHTLFQISIMIIQCS